MPATTAPRLASDLARLFTYDRWANGRSLESLERMANPPPKAVELIAHLLGAQVAWVERLCAGRDPADWQRWETMDVADARAAYEVEVPKAWREFHADPRNADLASERTYVDFLGQTKTARVEDALIGLLFHGAYHRGQIATHVRAAGGEPAVADFLPGVRSGGVPPI